MPEMNEVYTIWELGTLEVISNFSITETQMSVFCKWASLSYIFGPSARDIGVQQSFSHPKQWHGWFFYDKSFASLSSPHFHICCLFPNILPSFRGLYLFLFTGLVRSRPSFSTPIPSLNFLQSLCRIWGFSLVSRGPTRLWKLVQKRMHFIRMFCPFSVSNSQK